MYLQSIMFGSAKVSHEVVIVARTPEGDVYNKPIYEGTEQECLEYMDSQK